MDMVYGLCQKWWGLFVFYRGVWKWCHGQPDGGVMGLEDFDGAF